MLTHINPNSPQYKRAIELAEELKTYCKEHNLPNSMILVGVALDAEAVARKSYEQGYLDGKRYEKQRIADLLGLGRLSE